MKKAIAAILAVAMTVMLLVSLLEIRDLHGTIRQLQNSQIQIEKNLDRRMENIEQRVDQRIEAMLQEQQRVFHETKWEYGDMNIDHQTAEILVSVTPKVFDPAETRVQITIGGEAYPLHYQDGAYHGVFEWPMFEETRVTDLSLINGDTVQMEHLDWYWAPGYQMIVNVAAGVSGSSSNIRSDGKTRWTTGYDVVIYADAERPFRMEQAELVEVLNGKESGRLTIDLSDEAQKAYREEGRRGAAVEEAVPQNPDSEGMVLNDTIYYRLGQNYVLEPNSDMRLYVELRDSNGFIYRDFLTRMQTDSFGCGMERDETEPGAASDEWPATGAVYDPEGNLLISWD